MKSDTERTIKEILILGMYSLKLGLANSDTIANRKQEAFDYYLAKDFKQLDAEQMRFYVLVNTMYATILHAVSKETWEVEK